MSCGGCGHRYHPLGPTPRPVFKRTSLSTYKRNALRATLPKPQPPQPASVATNPPIPQVTEQPVEPTTYDG